MSVYQFHNQDAAKKKGMSLTLGGKQGNFEFRNGAIASHFKKLSGKASGEKDYKLAKLFAGNSKLEHMAGSLVRGSEGDQELIEHIAKAYEKYPAIAESSTEMRMGVVQALLQNSELQNEFQKAYETRVSELHAEPKYETEIPAMFPLLVKAATALTGDMLSKSAVDTLGEKAARLAILQDSRQGQKVREEFIQASVFLWENFSQTLNKQWDAQNTFEHREFVIDKCAQHGLQDFAFLSLTVYKSHLVFSKTAAIAARQVKSAPLAGMRIGRRVKLPNGEMSPTIFSTVPMKGTSIPPAQNHADPFVTGLLAAIEEIEAEKGSGYVGEMLRSSSDRDLRNYLTESSFNEFEKMVVRRSNETMSLFITQTALENFPLKFGTLGYRDNSMYVLFKSQAIHLMKLAGTSAAAYAHALGFSTDWLQNKPLYRVDIQFDCRNHPRVPNGKEGGANSFFQPGAFTSGGVRELVQDSIKFASPSSARPERKSGAYVLGIHKIGVLT